MEKIKMQIIMVLSVLAMSIQLHAEPIGQYGKLQHIRVDGADTERQPERYSSMMEAGVLEFRYKKDTVYRQSNGYILMYLDYSNVPYAIKPENKTRIIRLEDDNIVYYDSPDPRVDTYLFPTENRAALLSILTIYADNDITLGQIRVPEWNDGGKEANEYALEFTRYDNLSDIVDLVECVPVVKDLFTSQVVNAYNYEFTNHLEKRILHYYKLPTTGSLKSGESLVIPVLKNTNKGIVWLNYKPVWREEEKKTKSREWTHWRGENCIVLCNPVKGMEFVVTSQIQKRLVEVHLDLHPDLMNPENINYSIRGGLLDFWNQDMKEYSDKIRYSQYRIPYEYFDPDALEIRDKRISSVEIYPGTYNIESKFHKMILNVEPKSFQFTEHSPTEIRINISPYEGQDMHSINIHISNNIKKINDQDEIVIFLRPVSRQLKVLEGESILTFSALDPGIYTLGLCRFVNGSPFYTSDGRIVKIEESPVPVVKDLFLVINEKKAKFTTQSPLSAQSAP